MEDLHRASAESLELLSYLLPTVQRLPILSIGISREDEANTELRELSGVKHLRLGRLGDAQIARLCESMLGPVGKRPDVVGYMRKHSEGNVFFLGELVRAGRERGAARLGGSAGLSRAAAHRWHRADHRAPLAACASGVQRVPEPGDPRRTAPGSAGAQSCDRASRVGTLGWQGVSLVGRGQEELGLTGIKNAAKLIKDPMLRGVNYAYLVVARVMMQDWQATRELGNQAYEVAVHLNDQRVLGLVSWCAAWALSMLGDLDEARRHRELAHSIFAEPNYSILHDWMRSGDADAATLEGRPLEATAWPLHPSQFDRKSLG